MSYFFDLFLWNVLGLVSGFFLVSSKSIPRSWEQFKRELARQYHMVTSVIDGFNYMKMDIVELVPHAGRLAVITGGNRGIGAKVVEKLIKCKMNVVMGVRNPEEARRTMSRRINLSQNTNVHIHYLKLDIGNLESVRHFALAVQNKYSKIDILINNAGIMGVPFHLNEDGYESHFAVNYLGHFLLTHLLMPQLRAAGKKSRKARIINVSSCAHMSGEINMENINLKNNYCPIKAYTQSKLALNLFTHELQRTCDKAKNCHVNVYSVHPGIVATDHHSNFNISYFPLLMKLFLKTPEEGSRTIVFAAIEKSIENLNGIYLSHCVQSKENKLVEDVRLLEVFFDFTCVLLNIQDFGQVHNRRI